MPWILTWSTKVLIELQVAGLLCTLVVCWYSKYITTNPGNANTSVRRRIDLDTLQNSVLDQPIVHLGKQSTQALPVREGHNPDPDWTGKQEGTYTAQISKQD